MKILGHYLLLASLFFTGCAGVQERERPTEPGTSQLRVHQIDLRGVENVSENDLLNGLAIQEDPRWRACCPAIPLLNKSPSYFNEFHWRRDRDRILAFYRQRGYFDAAVVSESIIEDPDEGLVRIRVTIDEGEPTRIRRLEVQGLSQIGTPTQTELLRGLPLRPEAIFTQQDYVTTRNALTDRLKERGHAYATVSGRVFVDATTRSADVYFFADPGPKSRLGPVYILGLDKVHEEQVRTAIPIQQGDPYSPSALQRTQTELYDLGVFGLVTVLPAHEARDFGLEDNQERDRLEDVLHQHEVVQQEEAHSDALDLYAEDLPAQSNRALGISRILASAQRSAENRTRLNTEVPILIRVQEAKKYSVRVGAGVAVESTRQDARALFNWSARNFLGGLRRLDHSNAVGYAWAPNLFSDPTNLGVILSSELNFAQPQFIDRRTHLRLRASVARDVREGFSVWNPSFRISLDRPIFDRLVFRFSYNLSYYNFFNVVASLIDPSATSLGLDFRDEFLLEFLEQTLALDFRNDILNPTSGYRLTLTVQEATRLAFGGDFDFIKPILSGEMYLPFHLGTPMVLAMRSRLGAVYNVGQNSSVPVQNRLYSGGTDGMRSFGRRRLSLYTPSGEAIPIGGLTQFEASIEPRFRLLTNLAGIGDVWGALFVDSATILGDQFLFDTSANQRDVATFDDVFSSLLFGTGLGAWWNTPVGPVRLDFAYNLTDTTDDPRFRRCVNPDTSGTAACEFVALEDDQIQDLLLGWGLYLSIGHSF